MDEARAGRVWARMIGEFTVIVIGVLVALALDQWASGRSDRVAEGEYLTALVADLEADEEFLVGLAIPLMALADTALEEVGPVSRGEAAFPVDTLAFLRRVVSSRRTLAQTVASPTFDELISTGSLRLIESAELRASLLLYHEHMEAMESRSQERSSGYAALVRGHLPDDPQSGADLTEAELRAYGLVQASEAVQEPEFEQALNRHVAYVRFVLSELRLLQAELELLLGQARGELDRFQ